MGKTSLCNSLVEDGHFHHLHIEGERWPDGTISRRDVIKAMKVAKKEMKAIWKKENSAPNFIVEGFPRNLTDMDVWDELMKDFCHTQYMNMAASHDLCVERITTRAKSQGQKSKRKDLIREE